MTTLSRNPDRSAMLMHRVFWRLHFWAGVLVAPLVLFAALTGILYIFTPQIEAWKYVALDKAASSAAPRSLDQQLESAHLAFPDWSIKSIVPSYAPGSTTQVYLSSPKAASSAPTANQQTEVNTPQNAQHPAHRHHPVQPDTKGSKATEHGDHHATALTRIAYVDPGTTQLQGSLLEQDRFRNWARRLHSRMLQNDAWRWLIELAASWMLIMMMTGIYLWWPRGKATWRNVLQWKSGTGGRAAWRYLHSMTSIIMALMTTTILMTGLTWSKYAGNNFRALQQATAQNTPAAPRDLHSDINGMATGSLSWQAIYDKARQVAPDIEMQLTPPKSANGVWRIENSDRSQPEKRFQLALDAYSGQVLYRSAWTDMPALSRATAIGIPFHRGEFGWWNQALLFLVGLSVIFSVISGYVMWLQRRKAATLSVPKITRAHATAIPWWIWACMVTLGVALPVLGVSMCIVLLLESLNLLRNRHWTTA